jgi:hypothetical protein
MKLLGFTAHVSLYTSSRHYRGAAPVANSPGKNAGAIYPAMDEVVEVYGCDPGFLELGEGPNMVCIPDPAWSDGGGGGGGRQGGGGGRQGGGGKRGKPSRPSRPEGPPRPVLGGRCGCRIFDPICIAHAIFNRQKHEACENAIQKCVDDQCEGLTHKARGRCEQSCTDIVGRQEVCKSDPCFDGVPCTPLPGGGFECNPLPGCPGTYRGDEPC